MEKNKMTEYMTSRAERERELAKSKQVKLFWTEEDEDEILSDNESE